MGKKFRAKPRFWVSDHITDQFKGEFRLFYEIDEETSRNYFRVHTFE